LKAPTGVRAAETMTMSVMRKPLERARDQNVPMV
jgi:hypothetical protein